MKEDTTHIDPTWMEQTGGYAKDMTLRDYFAAKAMQGLIGCSDWREAAGEDIGMDASDYTVGAAYMMADAMLKARNA